MKNRRKDPKYVKRFQARAVALTAAYMSYRAVLRSLVGWDEFQNIDARATADHLSLHDAAKAWLDGTWAE